MGDFKNRKGFVIIFTTKKVPQNKPIFAFMTLLQPIWDYKTFIVEKSWCKLLTPHVTPAIHLNNKHAVDCVTNANSTHNMTFFVYIESGSHFYDISSMTFFSLLKYSKSLIQLKQVWKLKNHKKV